MHSEAAVQAFTDMLGATTLIRRWVVEAGGTRAALTAETVWRSAIERQLLVISEAAIRLHRKDPALLSTLAPEIDWAGVRGMGNVLRHRYDGIDPTVIATVLDEQLEQIESACARLIAA